MLTVFGSVASSFGPREVATICTVGAGVAVKSITVLGFAILGVADEGAAVWVCVLVGEHAATKIASRLRLALSAAEGKIRIFILFLGELIT